MTAPSSRASSAAGLGRAALLALAAACAGSTGGSGPPGVAPAPARMTCEFAADSGASTPDTLYVVTEPGAAAGAAGTECADSASGARPMVDSVPLPRGADLRDLLDRGLPVPGNPRVDVLVTRDPEALAYAAQLGGYRSVPLPWDRTYVLVAPIADSSAATPTAEQRDALARDAVQADARGAEPPFWWQRDAGCTGGAVRFAGGAPRVVGYAADDPIARQLAERIVALAGGRDSLAWLPRRLTATAAGPIRAAGFAPVALNNALAAGQIVAFVGAYPRTRPAVCTGTTRVPVGATLLPLVDSRAHALVRRGSGAAFFIRSDGSLRFVPNPTP